MKIATINKTKVKIFEEQELREKLNMNENNINIVLEYQRLFPELLQSNCEGFCIDARNLHKNLVENVKEGKIGTEFAKWIKRKLDKYKFEENIDYKVIVKKDENPNGGRPSTEYILTLDTAKQLCMIENNERGNLCRKYFICIEKTFRNYEEWNIVREPEKKNANILKSKLGEWASKNLDCYDIKAICSREFNMINKNLLSLTALEIKIKLGYLDKNTREHLTKKINNSINYLQEFDINLLQCNIDFKTRNKMIKNICDSRYLNLKEEFNK